MVFGTYLMTDDECAEEKRKLDLGVKALLSGNSK